ncbi:unnamed protein product [Rotaria sordida]|uniref:Cytochrome P450 n=1 Tax=Rotaria sordida TaxID=392033 RepID=A0A815LHI0_9BILA|nr:unnamed protein product [Rotaria sordida]
MFYDLLRRLSTECQNQDKGVYCLWYTVWPIIFLCSAKGLETFINNSKQLVKSFDYILLEPWLKTGLLTSKNEKWRSRRRIITPSFHDTQLLNNYMIIFNEQACILARRFDDCATQPNKTHDLYPYISACTIDIIVEAATDTNPKAQSGDEKNEFVEATVRITEILSLRSRSPWMWLPFIFDRLPIGREQKKVLKVLHGFSRKVIEERLTTFNAEQVTNGDDKKKSTRRLVFLDSLLTQMHAEQLSLDDIQEEVDTFMFEGHDTTAAALNFFCYLMGCYPDVQAKVHAEMDSIFGDDRERPCTMDDIQQMTYLDCVIKESMRILPPVPIIGREAQEDFVYCGQTIRKGTHLNIFIHGIHFDANIFPNPNKFDPERFAESSLISKERSPFAFIPFSAGSRNCIGMAERSKKHPACQYQTDKPWLDPQTHQNNGIKRPDELENEMKDPPLDEADNDILNHIHGSMIGMALGDIIGAHVEFRPREYLLQYPVTELKGGGTWGLKEGQVNCSEEGAAGNGALMRLAPVPLFFHRHPQYAVQYSGLSGLITHGDTKVYDACRYYGALIVAAVNKEPKEKLLHNNFYEEHEQWFAGKSLHPDIERIARGSYQKKEGYDKGIRGKGYIVDALEAALWAFWSDEGDFQNGVLAAVNLGDDTDTTAAIYGQLAGACYGYEKLRKDWVEQVYAKNFIECLSKWIAYEGKEWSSKQTVMPNIPYVTIQPPPEDDSASSLVQKKNLLERRASKSPTEQLNPQSNSFSKFEQLTGLNTNHRPRTNTVIDRPSNLKSGSEVQFVSTRPKSAEYHPRIYSSRRYFRRARMDVHSGDEP